MASMPPSNSVFYGSLTLDALFGSKNKMGGALILIRTLDRGTYISLNSSSFCTSYQTESVHCLMKVSIVSSV